MAYLALALWTVRDVLSAPETLLPMVPSARARAELSQFDQQMVVSVVTRNARLLPTRPWALAVEGQCFPTPHPYTLGEHMFGNGLVSALPYAATRDPIVSYNVLLVLTLWIPALTMYALSLYFTGSPAAAFVAGLVYAFMPERLDDPVHLYSHRDLWTPLAMLFLHRLFSGGTWGSAFGLAAFFALGIGESLYTLVSSAILVTTLGVYLCFRYASRLPRLLPKLLFCGAFIAAVAWLVFAPYLETAHAWSVLRADGSLFARPSQFLPGQPYFVGLVGVALVLIALLDRLRGARTRRGYDPRLVFFVAGLLVVWCSTRGFWLPGLDFRVRSPLALARKVVPGLDSVRVMAAVSLGQYLAVAFLAGYGVQALLRPLRDVRGVAVASVVSLAFLLEVFAPSFAAWSFGRAPETEARPIRPPEEEIEFVERTAEGAVLDVPHLAVLGRPELSDKLDTSAHYLLLGAFHGRSTAACYNSFRTAAQAQITVLATAVPDSHAIQSLAALGFRTIFVHERFLPPGSTLAADLARVASEPGAPLAALGRAGGIAAYRVESPRDVQSDFASLKPVDREPERAVVSPPEAPLRFEIENVSATTFLHPKPLLPSDLVVRWRSETSAQKVDERARALLPLALASGATAAVAVTVPVPAEPGPYKVTLSRAAEPDIPLGRIAVTVGASVGGQ